MWLRMLLRQVLVPCFDRFESLGDELYSLCGRLAPRKTRIMVLNASILVVILTYMDGGRA